MMKGYDEFTYDPGLYKIVHCKVCGDECKFRGTRYGPRSFAGTMAGKASDFDFFECLNKKEGWHKQALALIQSIQKTPSAKLAKIMEEELKEVLDKRTITKEDGY